jgi:hypothetical protein
MPPTTKSTSLPQPSCEHCGERLIPDLTGPLVLWYDANGQFQCAGTAVEGEFHTPSLSFIYARLTKPGECRKAQEHTLACPCCPEALTITISHRSLTQGEPWVH